MPTQVDTAEGVVTMSATEYDDLFDRIARKNMGISGAEFLRRWGRWRVRGRRLGFSRRLAGGRYGGSAGPVVAGPCPTLDACQVTPHTKPLRTIAAQ